jgi:hypothetical protein
MRSLTIKPRLLYFKILLCECGARHVVSVPQEEVYRIQQETKVFGGNNVTVRYRCVRCITAAARPSSADTPLVYNCER